MCAHTSSAKAPRQAHMHTQQRHDRFQHVSTAQSSGGRKGKLYDVTKATSGVLPEPPLLLSCSPAVSPTSSNTLHQPKKMHEIQQKRYRIRRTNVPFLTKFCQRENRGNASPKIGTKLDRSKMQKIFMRVGTISHSIRLRDTGWPTTSLNSTHTWSRERSIDNFPFTNISRAAHPNIKSTSCAECAICATTPNSRMAG